MASKAQIAGRATDQVRARTEEAVALLGDGEARAINAIGVFMQPLTRRATLLAAKQAIEQALDVMDATAWPTAADYDSGDHDNDFLRGEHGR
jgi:hypothetical protein